ncbi:hypothetical protein [Micromonospora sp. M71_S20]|uniref:hypothetical protein n=1 Tax=Micromonospora sp. M71_S20 TaxID=592872 RepID=UPI001F3B4882|nr:hypothetical protein [Micromonospora sp. M71_S20]
MGAEAYGRLCAIMPMLLDGTRRGQRRPGRPRLRLRPGRRADPVRHRLADRARQAAQRGPLDWLAGDPAQITAHAQTWRNVAASLRREAADLAAAVRTDVAGWGGGAGPAYRVWAAEQQQAIGGLAQGADTLAAITEGAAGLVAAVRLLVRDAITTCVSRLIVYASELVITGGLAAPLWWSR